MLLALLCLLVACAPDDEPATERAPGGAPVSTVRLSRYPEMPTELERGTVDRVIDGDTVDVLIEGEVVRLRLIGMNTPESVDPRRPVQCFGKEASSTAKELLGGATVLLETDPTQAAQDRYGRTLGYLWFPDGRLFNLEMIALGYAHEYTYSSSYKYQSVFREAEADARGEERGLWSSDTCAGDTDQPAPPTATPRPTSCEPAYPDLCLPPPPPDLDCGDIPYRNFRVLPPDPHRFDGGGDGVGCEG